MLLNKTILKYKKLINISFYYIVLVKQGDIHHLKNKKCTYYGKPIFKTDGLNHQKIASSE